MIQYYIGTNKKKLTIAGNELKAQRKEGIIDLNNEETIDNRHKMKEAYSTLSICVNHHNPYTFISQVMLSKFSTIYSIE